MLFVLIFCFIKINFQKWYFKLLITFYFLTELVHILKTQGLRVMSFLTSAYVAATSCIKITAMFFATTNVMTRASMPSCCFPSYTVPCFHLRFSLGWCRDCSHSPVQPLEKAMSALHLHFFSNSCLRGILIHHRSLLFSQSECIAHHSCHIGYIYNNLLGCTLQGPKIQVSHSSCVLNSLSVMGVELFILLGSFFPVST